MCLLLCILGLYVHLPDCLIFCSVFAHSFIIFFARNCSFCILLMLCRFLSVCLPPLPCFFSRSVFVFVHPYDLLIFLCVPCSLCARWWRFIIISAILSSLFIYAICCVGWHVSRVSFDALFCNPVCLLVFLLPKRILLGLCTPSSPSIAPLDSLWSPCSCLAPS